MGLWSKSEPTKSDQTSLGYKKIKQPRYECAPPDNDLSFHALMRYCFEGGIGNYLDELGQPKRWTRNDWESIRAEDGFPLAYTTFVNWVEGGKPHNMSKFATLSKVIFPFSDCGARLWHKKFADSYMRTFEQTGGKNEAEQDTYGKAFADFVPALPPILDLWARTVRQLRRRLTIAWYKIEPRVDLATGQPAPETPDNVLFPIARPSVINVRFCDEVGFSQGKLVCDESRVTFPAGTKRVFMSFAMYDMPTGMRFKREWYRNGEKFIEKNDYFDDAWPGYTFLWNENGHDPGRYDVRISVNKILLSTNSFTIG